MAISITMHNKFKVKAYDSSTKINLATGGDTIKLFLATSAHAPVATDEYFSDMGITEVTGTGYSAGGLALDNQTYTESGGTATFDADDEVISESASGFSNARYGGLYKDTGTPSTSPIICSFDLGADKGNTTGDLTFSWNASGIFTLS